MALVLAAGAIPPGAAWAAPAEVYTATVNPQYANPATGVVEDAVGEGNAALGESMVEGTTYGKALVERYADGAVYVTLRFNLIDQISAMRFEYSTDGGGTFSTSEATETQRNASDNTADYRLAVPDEGVVVRCVMDVIPMGRSVTFFVTLGDLQAGNSDTFIPSERTVEESAGESPATEPENTPSADGAAVEPSAATDGGASPSEGVREFDADGHEVGEDDPSASSMDGATMAVVVGVIVAVGVVGGVVVYVTYLRPKRARQAAAAAAAAGSPQADTGRRNDGGEEDEKADRGSH